MLWRSCMLHRPSMLCIFAFAELIHTSPQRRAGANNGCDERPSTSPWLDTAANDCIARRKTGRTSKTHDQIDRVTNTLVTNATGASMRTARKVHRSTRASSEKGRLRACPLVALSPPVLLPTRCEPAGVRSVLTERRLFRNVSENIVDRHLSYLVAVQLLHLPSLLSPPSSTFLLWPLT